MTPEHSHITATEGIKEKEEKKDSSIENFCIILNKDQQILEKVPHIEPQQGRKKASGRRAQNCYLPTTANGKQALPHAPTQRAFFQKASPAPAYFCGLKNLISVHYVFQVTAQYAEDSVQFVFTAIQRSWTKKPHLKPGLRKAAASWGLLEVRRQRLQDRTPLERKQTSFSFSTEQPFGTRGSDFPEAVQTLTGSPGPPRAAGQHST